MYRTHDGVYVGSTEQLHISLLLYRTIYHTDIQKYLYRNAVPYRLTYYYYPEHVLSQQPLKRSSRHDDEGAEVVAVAGERRQGGR